MMEQRVIISGGGTAGHLYPALVLGKKLQEQGIKITFVGSTRKLEQSIMKHYDADFIPLKIEGIKGKGFLVIKSVLILPYSLIKSLLIIIDIKPALVIGMGGYSSGPIVLISSLIGIDLLARVDVGLELVPLAESAFPYRQLVLVHVRVTGVEVGIGFLRLGDVAYDFSIFLERLPDVLESVIDRCHRAWRIRPGWYDVNTALLAASRVRSDNRPVRRSSPAHNNIRAGIRSIKSRNPVLHSVHTRPWRNDQDHTEDEDKCSDLHGNLLVVPLYSYSPMSSTQSHVVLQRIPRPDVSLDKERDICLYSLP